VPLENLEGIQGTRPTTVVADDHDPEAVVLAGQGVSVPEVGLWHRPSLGSAKNVGGMLDRGATDEYGTDELIP